MPSPLKFVIAAGGIALAVAVTSAAASGEFAFDHLSLNVADPVKAVEWYSSKLGGTPDTDAVRFGPVRLSFRKSATSKPSAGTVIDHLAFAADTLPEGFSEDPWGTRIENRRNQERRGLDHVHVLSTDPEATVRWLTQSFGGERARLGDDMAVKFGSVMVAVQRVERAPEPTAGHVIDHFGFAVANVDASAAALAAGGVTFTIQPRSVGTLRMAFVAGPDQLRVEIVQR